VPAIQAMKAAFYEKMAGLLPEHMAGSRACVVYDVDAATQGPLADTSALEIVTSTGFAFRARIHHERERTLLERIIASRDETPARKREARSALVRFAQRFDSATRHHATVATLQARLIALGEATRLLKRWVSAQMLSHISPELLELLALHVFLQPGAQPHSAAAGFARTLQTLATWRWRDEPLLVACHAAVDAPEGEVVAPRFPLEPAAQAEKALKTVRSQDPSKETRTWLIATEKDVEGTDWASRGPTAAEAHLLQQLAAGAVQYLSAKSASLTAADVMVRRLCATRTSYLADTAPFRRSSRPRWRTTISSFTSTPLPCRATRKACRTTQRGQWRLVRRRRVASPTCSTTSHASAPSREPASTWAPSSRSCSWCAGSPSLLPCLQSAYRSLLQSLFDDTLRLFYDAHGGSVICGLWNPSLRTARPFKTLLGFASRPAAAVDGSKKASVVLDEEAVCAEITRLGAGLVTRVERRKTKAQ
jgi:U3 small nucleolar RNA-associated protein 22